QMLISGQKNRKWEPASRRRCWTWQSLVPFEPPRSRSGQILRVDWIEGRPDPIRRTPNQSGTHWILFDVAADKPKLLRLSNCSFVKANLPKATQCPQSFSSLLADPAV